MTKQRSTYLKTGTLISKLSDSVKDKIDDLFTNGVVTTGVVVGGILLSSDQLFGVEKLSVGSGSDLVNNSWLQINKDGSGDVLASTSLREKGVERIISSSNCLVRWHLNVKAIKN